MKAARSQLAIAAIVTGLVLPSLTLIPLGSIWLWQHGYLLHWAVVTVLLVGLAYLVQRRILGPLGDAPRPGGGDKRESAEDLPDPTWTPAEEKAWADVMRIADGVDVMKLTSREAVLALGAETVRTVARRMHPEVAEPLWQFTLPEAFAILERVSRRLGKFTAENVPLSDRLTVSQALSLYRWRGALEVAEKAYDVWRLVRVVNPVTAATHELRERLSRQMLHWGRTHVAERLAHAYVAEVGRAAIDLYGGRLRVSAKDLAANISDASKAEAEAMAGRSLEPLRILVAGQTGAGKSSLVNALSNEVHAAVDSVPTTLGFEAYQVRKPGFPDAHVIDTPGLVPAARERDALTAKALDSDIILWVAPAHRADRALDREAMAAIRQKYAALPNRRRPPMILALTHIDRLRPFDEWQPPYDLSDSGRPKSVSIRAAMTAAAEDFDLSIADIVPVSLAPQRTYNIDVLWARMLAVAPEAQMAQLVRRLRDVSSAWGWRRVWSQATAAGRVIGRTLGPRRR